MSTSSSVHHVGLTVSALERSLSFYSTCFGFEKSAGPVDVDNRWIGAVTGHEGVRIRVAFMSLGEMTLELLEYDDEHARTRGEPDPAEATGYHLALIVDDVDDVFHAVRENGGGYISSPCLVDSGGWAGRRLAYVRDPDGSIVELIQEADESGEVIRDV